MIAQEFSREIPFTGYVTLPLQLGTNPNMQLDLPFLVIPEQLPQPIIGFNVVNIVTQNAPSLICFAQ